MKPSQIMSEPAKPKITVEEDVKAGISVGSAPREFVAPSNPPKSFDTVGRGKMPAIIFRNGKVELQYQG